MTRVLRLVFRVAVCGLAVWLCACVVLAAIVYRTGTIDEARDADVIIVLGAALKSDGRPNKALSRRSRHAAALWKAGHAASIICTGGVGPGLARSEADGCREVATGAGVPAGAILLEEASHSTEENASNARSIMDAHGWQTAIVVSDSYHVARARRVFCARRRRRAPQSRAAAGDREPAVLCLFGGAGDRRAAARVLQVGPHVSTGPATRRCQGSNAGTPRAAGDGTLASRLR